MSSALQASEALKPPVKIFHGYRTKFDPGKHLPLPVKQLEINRFGQSLHMPPATGHKDRNLRRPHRCNRTQDRTGLPHRKIYHGRFERRNQGNRLSVIQPRRQSPTSRLNIHNSQRDALVDHRAAIGTLPIRRPCHGKHVLTR